MACRVVEWVGRDRKSHRLPNRSWSSRDQFSWKKQNQKEVVMGQRMYKGGVLWLLKYCSILNRAEL